MKYQITFTRRLLTLLVTVTFLTGIFCLAGADTAEAASLLKVTSSKRTIYVGNKVTVKANRAVKWNVSGSKSSVKIVSKTSKKLTVKGVKSGTAYINAKSGGSSKRIKIEVRSKVPSKINLVSSEDAIGVGRTCTVYVKSVEPSYASSDVILSSSDKEIATVDKESGMVTGVSAGTVTITAKSKLDGKARASVDIRVLSTLKGNVTMTVNMTDESRFPAGKVAKVWLPVPQSEDNQNVVASIITCKADAASVKKLTRDSSGNTAYYVEWDENTVPEDRKAVLTFHVERRAVVRTEDFASKEQGSVNTGDTAAYLKETESTGSLTEGIVKETADRIVSDAGAASVYDKAHAIYEWVCDNLLLKKGSQGITAGNAAEVLESLGGRYEMSDAGAVFVALCRASGVPARSIYGIRLDVLTTSRTSVNVQKERTQFYMPGCGWIDADPAAALSVIAGYENLYRGENAVHSTKWRTLKDRNWVSSSESWVKLSSGENIALEPSQSAGSSQDSVLNENGRLNYFAYPYAEYDERYVRCYNNSLTDKSELTYKYEFVEDVEDCGCD